MEKKKKEKRRRQRKIWRKDEKRRGVRTKAAYSTLAVDVKHPSHSQ